MGGRLLLAAALLPDCAEFIIGPAEGRTRWLHPGYWALLPRQLDREFPISDALWQALGIAGRGILAIGRNQFAERSEQADLRHAVAVDARQASLDPGLLEEIECGLLLLVIRQGTTRHRYWFHDDVVPTRPTAAPRCGMQTSMRIAALKADL